MKILEKHRFFIAVILVICVYIGATVATKPVPLTTFPDDCTIDTIVITKAMGNPLYGAERRTITDSDTVAAFVASAQNAMVTDVATPNIAMSSSIYFYDGETLVRGFSFNANDTTKVWVEAAYEDMMDGYWGDFYAVDYGASPDLYTLSQSAAATVDVVDYMDQPMNLVRYDGVTYIRSSVDAETLAWLDWYNGLPVLEQELAEKIEVSGRVFAASEDDIVASTATPLTAEQVEAVNDAFALSLPDGTINPLAYFLMSYYAQAQDMDLGSFVYYMERKSFVTAEDSTEIQHLIDHGIAVNFLSMEEFPVPFGRIPYPDVEVLLEQYMNLSLSDMTQYDSAMYADDYQCFYSYASDFGLGMFPCIGGDSNGDTVRLYSTWATLTLEQVDGQYYIVSYLKFEE